MLTRDNAGPSRSAQADEGSLRPQIHQQGSLRQAESRLKHHPGEKAARRGPSPHSKTPSACCSHLSVLTHTSTVTLSHRSITLLSSTCAMPSKTTRTASSCSTSCLEVTSDVSARERRNDYPLKRSRLFLARPVSVHLERLGHLSEEAVLLYTAELSSALSYLHERRIIHRCADHGPAIFVQCPLTLFGYHLTGIGTSNRITFF